MCSRGCIHYFSHFPYLDVSMSKIFSSMKLNFFFPLLPKTSHIYLVPRFFCAKYFPQGFRYHYFLEKPDLSAHQAALQTDCIPYCLLTVRAWPGFLRIQYRIITPPERSLFSPFYLFSRNLSHCRAERMPRDSTEGNENIKMKLLPGQTSHLLTSS